MIIVRKNGYLKYKNFKFRCSLGKGGAKEKNKEGDKVTPTGTYRILNIYYRQDRVKKIKTSVKKIKINNLIKNKRFINSLISNIILS